MEDFSAHQSHELEPRKAIAISGEIYARLDSITQWVISIDPNILHKILGTKELTVDGVVEATITRKLDLFETSLGAEEKITLDTRESTVQVEISRELYERLQILVQLIKIEAENNQSPTYYYENLSEEHVVNKIMTSFLEGFNEGMQEDS